MSKAKRAEWNELAGELRSALAARDWHQAGAIVWQLRQLDDERFTLELEHYTNEQVRKGGYGMALETEQRLEAVRRWAKDGAQVARQLNLAPDSWPLLLRGLVRGETVHDMFEWFSSRFEGSFALVHLDRMIRNNATNEIVLDYSCLPLAGTFLLTERDERSLREDARDVLWVVLQELGEPSEQDWQDHVTRLAQPS